MKTRTMLAAAGVALLGAVALSGCTTAPLGDGVKSSNQGGDGTDAAAAFLACLKTGGVDAKINDSGQVLVKMPPKQNTGGETAEGPVTEAEDGALAVEGDAEGNSWVAAAGAEYFADDPKTQDAYAACEKQHPEFSQAQIDPENDPEIKDQMAQQQAAGLKFAQCARKNGYIGIADPDPATGGAVMLPDDMTEEGFRSLAKECYDAGVSIPFGVSDDLSFDPWTILEELAGEPSS